MGEGEQGLAAGGQAPPPGADRAAVAPQLLREEAEGGTGHVDTRRVNKHAKPLVETVLLVENPSTRGFTTLSAQLWYSSSRLEKAQWLPQPEVTSPTLRAKLLAAGLDGLPEPVNTSALIHDFTDRPTSPRVTRSDPLLRCPVRINQPPQLSSRHRKSQRGGTSGA
ncbi:hypothetical protein Srut_56760 [Streptomyces rutgersensis]|nr:hypothetical protein Srut_56760 [Streptomyces rutgersensis]